MDNMTQIRLENDIYTLLSVCKRLQNDYYEHKEIYVYSIPMKEEVQRGAITTLSLSEKGFLLVKAEGARWDVP